MRRQRNGKTSYLRDATMGAAAKASGGVRILACTCGGCGHLLGPECFSRNARNPWGLQSLCKACNAAWQRANPEKRRDTWNRYRKATYLVNKYGITVEFYDLMFEEQGRVCAMCKQPGGDTRENRQPLHVDHDHACCSGAKTCGQCIRGLLCKPCNTMLGNAFDDPRRLAAGILYLMHGWGYATDTAVDSVVAAAVDGLAP